MPLQTMSSASVPIDHVPALRDQAGMRALAVEENFLEGLAGGLLERDCQPGDDQPGRGQQHEAPHRHDAHDAPAGANHEHARQCDGERQRDRPTEVGDVGAGELGEPFYRAQRIGARAQPGPRAHADRDERADACGQ